MNDILQFLEHLITTVPLEVFIFIGTCLDEIISPIPAFFVLIPAGIAADMQNLPLWYLIVLALISGVARTLSGYILYLCADKLEDILFARGRKFFGATHKDIERYGKKLAGANGAKSWWLLFAMHALPVFPGTLLSLGSGFIRLPLAIFTSATALGSALVALLFLYLGYTGMQTASLIKGLDATTQIITIVLLCSGFAWLFVRYRRTKQHPKKR
ncbi:MAG TPA: VTT domain-containing protein [Candidatus Saccharimonadales bacterium]|nr:VTT domain-containing protein [Candidatus Saccharimonadales bacterium]